MGNKRKTLNGSGLQLEEIEPLTKNQLIAFGKPRVTARAGPDHWTQ